MRPVMNGYNLTDQTWIPVETIDGRHDNLSLNDVFDRANHIRHIEGDTTMQTIALYRLLSAIDMAAIRDHTTIKDYLHQWHDRFDLYDPEHPFLQTPGLESMGGGTSGLGKLMDPVAPNNDRAFTSRYGRHDGKGLPAGFTLTSAQAARWLILAQQACCAGLKTGCKGDPEAKQGKRTGCPTGPLASTAVILVEGATLADTLRLNRQPIPTGDRPCWEKDDPHPFDHRDCTAKTGLTPSGPLDAYTWRALRCRLIHDGNTVTDAIVTAGDTWHPNATPGLDPMLILRHGKKETIESTFDHHPWRLYARPDTIRPTMMRAHWDEPVRITVCRYELGTQNSVVDAAWAATTTNRNPGEWDASLLDFIDGTLANKLAGWRMGMWKNAGLNDPKKTETALLNASYERIRDTFDRLLDSNPNITDACRRATETLLNGWATGIPVKARYEGANTSGMKKHLMKLIDEREKSR